MRGFRQHALAYLISYVIGIRVGSGLDNLILYAIGIRVSSGSDNLIFYAIGGLAQTRPSGFVVVRGVWVSLVGCYRLGCVGTF